MAASSGVFVQSQTQPALIHSEQDEIFNYELVYLRYMEACEDYFKKPSSITGPWTRKARNLIISSIKAKNKMLSLLCSVYDLEPNVLEKYEIVLEDGEEKLVLADTAIEVLPYEECFDIFVELHKKTGHGDFDVILNKIKTVFLVSDVCLNIFLSNCDICKKINLQKMEPVQFNDSVDIEILKAPIQDLECRFILFYIDKLTNFMLLRPLIAMDEYEISIEMLKIFTDFGPPAVIKTIHAPLFHNVLTILEGGGFSYDISIYASDKIIGESYDLMQEIVARTNEDSVYWSTVCRFVQYKHNNGKLQIHDPILNKVVRNTIKPFNQIFCTRHLSRKSTTKKEIPETFNIGNAIQEHIISSDSSNTETASEAEEYLSKQHMNVEEKMDISENQSHAIVNVTSSIGVETDKTTVCIPNIDNQETLNSDKIKIECNPVEVASPQYSYETKQDTEQNLDVPELKSVPANTNTPLIVDNISVKDKLVLGEHLTPSGPHNTPKARQDLLVPRLHSNAATSIPHNLSVGILRSSNKKRLKEDRKNNACCSVCNGKMLTFYFCFGCKRKTHIFCMSRVTDPLQNVTDNIISFTYCDVCLKFKFNLTNAVKISN